MRFFTADTHFFHHNVIHYCARPWATVEDMNEGLIANWNSVVAPNDEIIIAGDFVFGGVEKGKSIVSRLNGKKILVRGNHCQKQSKMLRMGFDVVVDSLVLDIGGVSVNVSHYPYVPKDVDEDTRYLDRRVKDNGDWLIHGHVHCTWKIRRNMINVGVDVWDFRPVSEKEILKIIL